MTTITGKHESNGHEMSITRPENQANRTIKLMIECGYTQITTK